MIHRYPLSRELQSVSTAYDGRRNIINIIYAVLQSYNNKFVYIYIWASQYAVNDGMAGSTINVGADNSSDDCTCMENAIITLN